MSELLFLKTLNNEFVLKGVRTVERYAETHPVHLNVLISDSNVMVYDDQVLLLNIPVQVKEVM
jgi:hypothetical protein